MKLFSPIPARSVSFQENEMYRAVAALTVFMAVLLCFIQAFLLAGPVEAKSDADMWRSDDLHLLGIGMGIGDVNADGRNEVVVAGPSSVHLYRIEQKRMTPMAEFDAGMLEIKSIDVAKIRKQGPARIYVSAQNRGSISSFVLELREGKLVRAVEDFPYYLRVITYPTHGPLLLGQRKGLAKSYDGPIYLLEDKGDELKVRSRFGVPLKIPIFGFAIGDFTGSRKPMIVVYDKDDHLRLYKPTGERMFLSRTFYGGSDIILRLKGPERGSILTDLGAEVKEPFFRPRILALDLDRDSRYEILAITHGSGTFRVLARSRMLRDGAVTCLMWNGDAVEKLWETPPVQGMITDFAVDTLPGLPGRRLITLERKKTDWLSFLKSRSQVRAYDLDFLRKRGTGTASKDETN